MRLLLDEDSQGKVLVRLLLEAEHDVETVHSVGIAVEPDMMVLEYAKRTERVLLTRNANDFRLLQQADSSHFGILVEYQDDDPSKNMTYEQIAAAISKIEKSAWRLVGEFVSLNAWR